MSCRWYWARSAPHVMSLVLVQECLASMFLEESVPSTPAPAVSFSISIGPVHAQSPLVDWTPWLEM